MRRISWCAAALAVLLGATACGSSASSQSSASGQRPNTGSSARSTTDPAGNKSIDGSSDTWTTPSPSQPGNPCDVTQGTSLFETIYGGTWQQDSPDNPPQSGPYKKRICVFHGAVPWANGSSPDGTSPVSIAVVSYIDDIQGTLLKKLVAQAKDHGTYVKPRLNNDNGSLGPDAFYDGVPGQCPLTAVNALNPVMIFQIVPLSDKDGALRPGPYPDHSQVEDMSRLLHHVENVG